MVRELPSMSNLSRFDDYRNINTNNEALISYLNSSFGDSSYFDREDYKYRDVFRKTVDYFYDRSMMAENDLKVSLGALSNIDAFRTCNTEESLRNIPPCMMEPLTFHTDIWKLYGQHKIQGWVDYDSYEIEEKRKKWRRILELNGVNRYDPRTSDKNKESTFRVVTKTDDPELTFEERDDIERTKEYIEWVLANTELDPTDLNEIRN